MKEGLTKIDWIELKKKKTDIFDKVIPKILFFALLVCTSVEVFYLVESIVQRNCTLFVLSAFSTIYCSILTVAIYIDMKAEQQELIEKKNNKSILDYQIERKNKELTIYITDIDTQKFIEIEEIEGKKNG